MERKNDALIVVDVQNDFCPGGALAVPGGDEVVPVINELIDRFGIVIATQDWHPPRHSSFASCHPGKKPFDEIDIGGAAQTLWPDHCVQGTSGAEFHPGLNMTPVKIIVRKGYHPSVDSYSAFRENDHKTLTGLSGCLKTLGIERVYVCGLSLDFCVHHTALDAVEMDFGVAVVSDACRAIDNPPGEADKKIRFLKKSGVAVIKSSDV